MIAKTKPIPEEAPSDARLAKMRQAVDQIRENIQTRGAWVNLLAGARGLVAAGEYVEACILLEVLAAISLGWWCRCRLGKGISPGKSAVDMLLKLVCSKTIDRPAYDAAAGILKRVQYDKQKAQGLLDLIGWASDAIGDIHLEVKAKRTREEARDLYRGFSDPSDRERRSLTKQAYCF